MNVLKCFIETSNYVDDVNLKWFYKIKGVEINFKIKFVCFKNKITLINAQTIKLKSYEGD